jgi:hypothetical protein
MNLPVEDKKFTNSYRRRINSEYQAPNPQAVFPLRDIEWKKNLLSISSTGFDSPGLATITVFAVDANGTQTIPVQVNVEPAPPPE